MSKFVLIMQMTTYLMLDSVLVYAESYNFMGCRWSIPLDMERLSSKVYSSLTKNVIIDFEEMYEPTLNDSHENAEILEEYKGTSFHYQRIKGINRFSDINLLYLMRRDYMEEILMISSRGSSIEVKEINEQRVIIKLAGDGTFFQADCN
ncbi:hypothetical protein [Vibrio sp. SCSIO 43137]|uniref:hypothetical protein n=1 Tax=Vibrio sp. SCSIO 43137 TaxID=3021011 RepID=UPI0023074011|nr:hypothetical protein [Vibrio sp. SCSIO 43137]WCE28348.1 hypothetical protein PK654_08115 [Vibrio sp. SCSIO 43137]